MNKFLAVFLSFAFALPVLGSEEKIGDTDIALTLATLGIDLKAHFTGKSDIWWIGHRKCMADTADILFTRDQLSTMSVKMRIFGRDEVLKDPNWSKFANLIEYCKRKTDSEVSR